MSVSGRALTVVTVVSFGCAACSRTPLDSAARSRESTPAARQPSREAESAANSGELPSSSPAATDWPQFRGLGGRGVSGDRQVPTRWSATENVAWKTELPGAGASSPMVLGDRIFLTCHTGYGLSEANRGNMDELKHHVLCLSRQDGAIVWTKDLPTELPEQPYEKRMGWHGYASSTPATDGERVFVFFGKSGVFALDRNGERLWHADVGSRIHGWGSAASLIVFRDLVLANAGTESESLVALDAKSGRERWRAGEIKESWNTPLLVDVPGGKTELVVAVIGKLLGFDPTGGERLWTCEGIGCYVVPSLVAHDGVVFSTAGRQHETVAVRAGGRGDVTGSHLVWKARHGSNVPSPVYHDGHLYFVHEQLGVAYCLDAETGKVAYERRLTPQPGIIYASPVLADGKLYYVSRYGRVYVLAAKPEFELIAMNEMLPDKGPFNASPVVHKSQILLRSDGYLYCIGRP